MREYGLRPWFDRLLPAVCLVCGDPLSDGETRVCGLCWARASLQRHPRCARCGIALPDLGSPATSVECTDCADWLPYLREARAPYDMSGIAAAIVHALKYGGWRGLAEEMSEKMTAVRFSASVETEITGVVPVPLSRARLRERGFNQAALLASGLARRRGWPSLDCLVRVRHTRRQARLNTADRAANVAGAFVVYPTCPPDLQDGHVVLVDDVLTTGQTSRDCVRALCQAGARAVSVLTFARARPQLLA